MILVIGVILLCLLVIVLFRREHMTNSDMMKMLDSFGQHSKKKETDEVPIYGPTAKKVPKPVHPDHKKTDGASYPEIFGPDVALTPGQKQAEPKTEFDYNPDLQRAFPTDGPPQPFLGDFSKFQH